MAFDKHIAALAIGTFCLGAAELGIVPVLADIARVLHVTIPQAGLYVSAYAAGVCGGIIGLLLFGRDANVKINLLIAACLILCGNLGASFAQSDIEMLGARFVSGMPHGIFFALGAVACERLADPGKASRDVTLMVLGQTSANFLGVPLGAWLGFAFSWRFIFIGIASLAVVLIFALCFWLPSLPVKKQPLPREIEPLKHAWPWIILGGVALGSGGFYAYYSYADPIMETITHLPAEEMTLVMIVAGGAMFFGNLASAPLTKRFSDEALVTFGQTLIVIATLCALFFSANKYPAVFFLALAAFGYYFLAGPMQALIIQGTKDAKIIIAALGQVAYNGANAIGAWLGGEAIKVSDSSISCAIPASVLGFASAVLFVSIFFYSLKRANQRTGR